MRKYFTLVVREEGSWGPQFGSFDREEVEEEMKICNSSYPFLQRRNMRIIITDSHNGAIDAAVAEMNKEVKV